MKHSHTRAHRGGEKERKPRPKHKRIKTSGAPLLGLHEETKRKKRKKKDERRKKETNQYSERRDISREEKEERRKNINRIDQLSL